MVPGKVFHLDSQGVLDKAEKSGRTRDSVQRTFSRSSASGYRTLAPQPAPQASWSRSFERRQGPEMGASGEAARQPLQHQRYVSRSDPKGTSQRKHPPRGPGPWGSSTWRSKIRRRNCFSALPRQLGKISVRSVGPVHGEDRLQDPVSAATPSLYRSPHDCGKGPSTGSGASYGDCNPPSEGDDCQSRLQRTARWVLLQILFNSKAHFSKTFSVLATQGPRLLIGPQGWEG